MYMYIIYIYIHMNEMVWYNMYIIVAVYFYDIHVYILYINNIKYHYITAYEKSEQNKQRIYI